MGNGLFCKTDWRLGSLHLGPSREGTDSQQRLYRDQTPVLLPQARQNHLVQPSRSVGLMRRSVHIVRRIYRWISCLMACNASYALSRNSFCATRKVRLHLQWANCDSHLLDLRHAAQDSLQDGPRIRGAIPPLVSTGGATSNANGFTYFGRPQRWIRFFINRLYGRRYPLQGGCGNAEHRHIFLSRLD